MTEQINSEVGTCSTTREVLDRLGDTWSLLVINGLSQGPCGFGTLRRRVEGITQRMLTRTLRKLQRDGLVLRQMSDTVPPTSRYELSELCLTMLEPIRAISAWALQNQQALVSAQAKFDAEAPGS